MSSIKHYPKKAIKRLFHDTKQIIKNPIPGVWFHHNENDISKPKIVIIGPKNTPYENGFYCISFNFTKDFPFKPPKAKYHTTDGITRMNPNLYRCGKICLSLLGTWSGPQWTSCQNISSLALSIQTILNEHPIRNEPGFGKSTNTLYNKMIQHANIRVGVLQMINNPPNGFEIFRDKMIKYFLDNFDWYKNFCYERVCLFKNKKIKCQVYVWTELFNYELLLKKIIQLKNECLGIPTKPFSISKHIVGKHIVGKPIVGKPIKKILEINDT